VPKKAVALPSEVIDSRIYLIRGQKVMLDSDIARLYGVTTKSLNQQVRRNPSRFPRDFCFVLTRQELASLRSQFVTSNVGRGGQRYLPNAFTEHGVAMLSSVLNSERAVQVNIAIIRAFVRLREIMATHKDLAAKINELERVQEDHGANIVSVWQAIEDLQQPGPLPAKRKIGFSVKGA
jgi:hypothetical protein